MLSNLLRRWAGLPRLATTAARRRSRDFYSRPQVEMLEQRLVMDTGMGGDLTQISLAFERLSYEAAEGDKTVEIKVVRTGGVGMYGVNATWEIDVTRTAKLGLDFGTSNRRIVFGKDDTEKSISFTIRDDALDEGDDATAYEFFRVFIVKASTVLPRGGHGNVELSWLSEQAEVQIRDNDAPAGVRLLEYGRPKQINEFGKTAYFTFELTKKSDVPVLVRFRIETIGAFVRFGHEKADFGLLDGDPSDPYDGSFVVGFSPGETRQKQGFIIIDDQIAEDDEYFRIKVVGGLNLDTDWAVTGNPSCLAYIEDNDDAIIELRTGIDEITDRIVVSEPSPNNIGTVFVKVVLLADIERRVTFWIETNKSGNISGGTSNRVRMSSLEFIAGQKSGESILFGGVLYGDRPWIVVEPDYTYYYRLVKAAGWRYQIGRSLITVEVLDFVFE